MTFCFLLAAVSAAIIPAGPPPTTIIVFSGILPILPYCISSDPLPNKKESL
jgi:hypothetical protein